MSALAFDTLAYAKRLMAVGVPANQAEVQAEALAEIIEERLATKRDLIELEQRLELKLKELEMRMLLRFGAMLAASVAITVSLVKLL